MSVSPEPNDDASLWAEPPLSDVVLAEVIRQAEMHLDAQAARAYSSDARAMALMATIVSAAVGVFGFAFAMIQIDKGSVEAPAAFVIVGIFLISAAFKCFQAAKPIEFFSIGNRPMTLAPFMRNVGDQRLLNESYMRSLADRIKDNEIKIKASALIINKSIQMTVMGFIFGFIYYFILILVGIGRQYYNFI